MTYNKMRGPYYIWALIELTNGEKEWYCLSKVLRNALLWERDVQHNPYWKNTLIGNYLTVARSNYVNNQARLTVGKVKKIRIYHRRPQDFHWTRNQFINAEALKNRKYAFNYLKHDYSWYNRFAIWVALQYWNNQLKMKSLQVTKKKIRKIRGHFFYRKKP